jgi:hypothetical protein
MDGASVCARDGVIARSNRRPAADPEIRVNPLPRLA